MVLVGLTGGLATGKSTVARLFQDCGAIVIDADILARQIVRPGKPAWRDIVHQYGREVLQADRMLNRRALAEIVFRNPRLLQRLNTIVHPRVSREQARVVREIAAKNPDAVVIYDAPLLIEARAHKRMDRIVVVIADRETQITRLQRRNHMNRSEAIRRIRAQIPLRTKIKHADFIIDGARPLEVIRHTVRDLYDKLRTLAQKAALKKPGDSL